MSLILQLPSQLSCPILILDMIIIVVLPGLVLFELVSIVVCLYSLVVIKNTKSNTIER